MRQKSYFGCYTVAGIMAIQNLFLQMNPMLQQYKLGILCFVTAFIAAMIIMPPLIALIHRYKLFDVPDLRKTHSSPIPTMGGIAVCAGMCAGLVLWYHFTNDAATVSFFFSLAMLFAVGIMDDLKDIPAYYKLAIQLGVALLLTVSGVRITSFNGLLGIYELPLLLQYAFTMFAIVGITNAFNLIDGIDGLAGGLGFMSLIALGLFLTLSGEGPLAIIAFALAGALLGFLYYNFNPARIFMGDTGSLVLGFTISVLCVHLIRVNSGPAPVLLNITVIALSVVLIPVFDTMRVFSLRIGQGRSPFHPDKTHIHHLLTNNGWSHGFTSKVICSLHGFVLMLGFATHNFKPEYSLVLLIATMLVVVVLFKRMRFAPASKKELQLEQ